MNMPAMRRSSALLLQVIIVLLGIAALGWLIWEPHLEGRNAHATTFAIYFKDPFLAYVYLGSIPLFMALVRAFGLLGRFRRNGAFSPEDALPSLRTIKRCALAVIGFVAGAVVFITLFGDPDDRPAGFFMCLLAALGASVVATAAAKLGRNLQAAAGRSEARNA